MVYQLTECLAAYKSNMKYQSKAFDADRPVQYKKNRREMAKLCDVFGPVYLPYRDKNEITQEEQKPWQIYFKEENEKIRKDHVRIQEKIKDIRHNFSRAVVAGTWSGSGKIVFEHYDKLVKIWGGSVSTEPLSFRVDVDSFSEEQESSSSKSATSSAGSSSPSVLNSTSSNDGSLVEDLSNVYTDAVIEEVPIK